MECSDLREDMIEVLYGEASREAAERLEDHLRSCAPCREEISALRGVRQRLSAWSLPEPRRQDPWLRSLGAAAALLLALGGGLGFSGTQLRYEGGRMSLRLGRPEAEVEKLAEQNRLLLAQQKQELLAIRASLGSGVSDEALLREVEARISESDRRHEERLRASLEQYSRQLEAQRRYDLARVSAGLSYLEGKTGQDVARTAQLVGYVLKASEEK